MDYQELLQPIVGDSAVGSYLKNDRNAYRSLRNGFNAAQSSFRRLTETPESSADEELFEENQNNWLAVNQACWQTLTENSKDLEVYCWWVMSLAFQSQSIEKIATALATLVDFIDVFWPDIQPYLPDEKLKSTNTDAVKAQRAEVQLRPLIQLLGESANSGLLFMPLQMMPLIGDIDHAQYFSATKSGKLAQLKNKAQQTFSTYQQQITATVIALDNAISALDKLDVWLKSTVATLAMSNISSAFLKANLTDNLQAIKYLVVDCYTQWPLNAQLSKASEDKNQQITSSEIASYSEQGAPEQGQQTRASSQGPSDKSNLSEQYSSLTGTLNHRDQAFQELRKIANYFAEKEPHSPISFLLEKAIRWGYMSLPDLMMELVSGNDKVLNQINLIAGLNDRKAELADLAVIDKTEIKYSTSSPDSIINDKVKEELELTAPVEQSAKPAIVTAEDKPAPTSDFNW